MQTSLAVFCARIGSRLEEATLADKQAILQLVIKRIIIGDGSLEIRHVIPMPASQPGCDGMPMPITKLRSDRVDAAVLPGRPEHFGDSRLEAFMGVRDHQLHAAQPRRVSERRKLSLSSFQTVSTSPAV